MNESYQKYWSEFLAATGRDPSRHEEIGLDEFGDNPELADSLIKLILEGKKTATCGLLVAYEKENYPIPQVGDIGIFLDGSREPACVGQVIEVEVKPFHEIGEAFAYDEGEGDRSYESWRREHIAYFTRNAQELGEEFDERSLIVCERFKVLYQ